MFRGTEPEVFSSYPWTLLTLFNMMLFVFDLSLDDANNTGYAITIFLIFTVLTGILMLNLLVATMNDSYSKIQAESKLQWHLEVSLLPL